MYPNRIHNWMAGVAIVVMGSLGLTLSGCGGNDSRPEAVITGTVTFEGQPLEEGSIHFASPKTGESAFCNLEKGGAYRVRFPGADLNEIYEVTIQETVVNTPETHANEMKPIPKLSIPLPEKYKLRQSSGLTAKLEKPGENHVDFALTAN